MVDRKDVDVPDIEAIIDIAVRSCEQEGNLRFQEIELRAVKDGLKDPTPGAVERLCSRLLLAGMAASRVQSAMPEAAGLLADLRERHSGMRNVEDAIVRLAEQVAEMTKRTVAARRETQRLEAAAFDILCRMRTQPLSERLIRIAGDTATPATVAELLRRVEKDHEAVSSARAAWRQMHSSGPVLIVRDASTRQEVVEALAALEATGHASRHRRIFRPDRWRIGRSASTPRDRHGRP